jgi:hypothetical protein
MAPCIRNSPRRWCQESASQGASPEPRFTSWGQIGSRGRLGRDGRARRQGRDQQAVGRAPVADAQHQDRVLSDIALLLPEVRWAPLDNRVFEC